MSNRDYWFYRSSMFLLLFGAFTQIMAQQQFGNLFNRVIYANDYYFALPMYNPAFAGDPNQPAIGLSGSFGKAPQDIKPMTANIFAHGAIPSLNSGIGLVMQYHKFDDTYIVGAGASQQTFPTNKRLLNLGLIYSYKFEVGDISVLKLGLGASLLHFKSDQIQPSQGPSSQPIQAVNERTFKPSFDIGLSANILDFYAGLAIKYFNQPRFKFFEPGMENIFYRSAYIHAGYRWALLQDKLVLRPAVMVNPLATQNSGGFGTGSQPFVDLSLLVSYKDIVFAGTSYKINDDPFFLSLLLGARLGKVFQTTLSYHLPKKNTIDGYSRLEASLGFFLQSQSSSDW
jgi:hypothetical protein